MGRVLQFRRKQEPAPYPTVPDGMSLVAIGRDIYRLAKTVGGHSRETLFTREELTRLKFAVELIEQLEKEGNGA